MKEKITLRPEDIEAIKYHLDRKLPGQRMMIVDNVPIYEADAVGITDKGYKWANVHIACRENTMRSIRNRALPWLKGDGVDIGCGIEKITRDCIGIDNGMDYKDKTDADDFRDASDLTLFEDGQFEWLFSSNCLEHIANWGKALDEWVRVVEPGGVIFLYLPWPDKCPPQKAGVMEHHQWDPSPDVLCEELWSRGVNIIECDEEPDKWGCFVVVGRKL